MTQQKFYAAVKAGIIEYRTQAASSRKSKALLLEMMQWSVCEYDHYPTFKDLEKDGWSIKEVKLTIVE